MISAEHPEGGTERALRPRPTSATAEFNALTVEERLRLVRNVSGKQKYQLLLNARDCEELVRRLPSQEVYLLIKELGVEDCVELLAMATTEQMTTFFDLDLWQGEELMPQPTLEWLAMLLETGERKVVETAREMDFELLTLMLRKFIVITRGLESLVDEDALADGRSERIYEMDFVDSESAKIIGHFLDILYRHDRDFYLLLMETVRNEADSSLEDFAYQGRSARLQDRGFPDPFEALGVFAYLAPASFSMEARAKIPFRAAEEGAEAPGFVLAVPPANLLGEILARGLEPDACWELTYLLNKVMIAERVDVGDLAQVQQAMQQVYRYLNIALEHLAGKDLDQAIRYFDNAYLEYLFRLGLSLTLDLKKRAEALRGAPPAFYLDGPFRALLEALCRKRPMLYEGALDVHRAGERPFAAVEEVHLCARWLERIETQVRLFDGRLGFVLPDPSTWDLSGCVPENPEDVGLSDLFLTTLANRLLGGEAAPCALGRDDLARLWSLVTEEGRIKPRVREESRAWAEGLAPGAGEFADYCLDLWEEGLCSLEPRDLDPRFVGGLILRLDS
ncbi:DUF6178 family protein [Geoalkalibacter halelectricus]|uniref:DUF6178 family protein n=1 Tax=Geoalkalibacter halelectricus TaxID=2847045 RepID=A0ABY5ZPW9_9BACT|nr:DUF6178 family protein [Geoalkalibacter halelectricus]MDO3376927.1 DUF6178 family protein [Geoalkalibacter halelectricus]UWZ81151.1 DUF6178 family protein [Geoalkalibacter halelectricus]